MRNRISKARHSIASRTSLIKLTSTSQLRNGLSRVCWRTITVTGRPRKN
jgi:hypothetical protein